MGDHMMRGGHGPIRQLQDLNWGTFNHASHAPQLRSCISIIILDALGKDIDIKLYVPAYIVQCMQVYIQLDINVSLHISSCY